LSHVNVGELSCPLRVRYRISRLAAGGVGVDRIGVYQGIKAICPKKRDCCRKAHLVLFFSVPGLVAISGSDQTGSEDGRMPIQFGMVPDILKDRQNFQILKKSLSDLLCFRIMVKIVEAVGEVESPWHKLVSPKSGSVLIPRWSKSSLCKIDQTPQGLAEYCRSESST
jgi:hypothetical protein